MKYSSYSNRIGGFVCTNAGVIRDSYSDAKVKHDKNVAGFAYENTGEILKAVAQKRASGKSSVGCFYVKNKGSVSDCGWFCHSDKKKKSDENFADKDMVLEFTEISEIVSRLNLSGAWYASEGSNPRLELQNELVPVEGEGKTVIEIDSADKLLEISEAIASGDTDAADGYYRLTKNIRLGGKKWIPIGLSESTPFTGVFDGAGFTISGFKVKAKGLEAAGFFAHIKGGLVANLSLDCVVDARGGVLTGGMCADNGGTIINCRVVAKVYADRSCGGFVGKNTGTIERCAFIGKVSKPFPILLFFLPLVGILLILLVIGLILLVNRFSKPVYTPEVIDPNQVPVVDNGHYDPPPAGQERISIEMNQTAYFNVDTQVGKIDFVNPKRGTRNLLIRIHVSDAELLKKIGKTGRTA